MGQHPYPYTRKLAFRYTFVSKGKARIEKLVVFAPTTVRNIFNLGTPTRTALYRRILKVYYPTFSNEFIISALIEGSTGYREVPFDPSANEKYLAFFVQRIN